MKSRPVFAAMTEYIAGSSFVPSRSAMKSGEIIRWYGTSTDIDDRKRAEEQLRRSEAFLAEGQQLSLTGSFSWKMATGEITWSEQLYRLYEFEIGVPVTLELIRTRVHPEDLTLLEKMVEQARNGKNDFEWHYRLLMPDNSVKYLHACRSRKTRPERSSRIYRHGAGCDAETRLGRGAGESSIGACPGGQSHEPGYSNGINCA